MANVNIKINKSSREVSIGRSFAGVQLENLQDKFIVTFDTFVDGDASLEYEVNGEPYYVNMTKSEETYSVDITQVLISEEGIYPFQVRIVSGESIFKSKIFYLKTYPSINAQEFAPSYTSWKDWVIEYVDENGGAINVVQKNGVDLPIVDKVVNVEVPTKTSDIQNDSGYITSNDLPTVDQSYDGTSAKAQSGKAVAEALSTVTGVTDYNELDNIPIENIQDGTVYEEGAYYKQDKQYKYGKFYNNQSIDTTSRIYFDTSKTDEMVAWFKTLSYNGEETYGLATLIQGRGDFGLMVLKVVINNEDVYCLVRISNVVAFVYATDNGSFEGMSWTAGWHLDDGDFVSWDAGNNTIKYIVNDSDRWNGNFFGSSKTEISGDLLKFKDNSLTKQLFSEDRVLDLGTVYSQYGEIPAIDREIEISEDEYNKLVNNEIDAVKITVEFPDSNVYIGYKLYAGRITDVINYNPSNNQYANAYVFKGEIRFADISSDLIVAIAPTQTGYGATIQTQAKAKVSADDIDSGTAPSGRVIASDGSGGASWVAQTVEGANIKSTGQNANNVPISDGDGGVSWGKITTSQMDSGSATAGQVLTADGNGGAGWQSASGGGTTLNKYTYTATNPTNTTFYNNFIAICENAKGQYHGDLKATINSYSNLWFNVKDITLHGSGGYWYLTGIAKYQTTMFICYMVLSSSPTTASYMLVIDLTTSTITSTQITSFSIASANITYYNDTQLHT